MTDSSPQTDQGESGTDNRFVLRLLVVKVEGVLVNPTEDWNLTDVNTPGSINPDNLFPAWCDSINREKSQLRSELVEYAQSGEPTVDPELRSLIDTIRNHTPIRVAFLSSGPREWVDTLESNLDLTDLRDLTFCYDNYTHGTRRTLLQFLMNRFIAGKGRTLLLGRTPADEHLAAREKTRFRSLEPAPESARSPGDWDWSLENLESFMKDKQPQE